MFLWSVQRNSSNYLTFFEKSITFAFARRHIPAYVMEDIYGLYGGPTIGRKALVWKAQTAVCELMNDNTGTTLE